MSQEPEIDVILRDETVVVIDGSGESFELGRTAEGVVVEDAPEHVRNAIKEEDALSVLEETYEFPMTLSYGHHLEDSVLYRLSVQVEDSLESIFRKEPSLPSMELQSQWSFNEDGDATLEYVEYDGTKYTPDN